MAIQVDVGAYHKPRTADGVVGVDLGITTLATLSTGEKIEGPQSLKANINRLRRLSRALSRKQKGSNNRKKSADCLSRLHARIANIRRDASQQLTTKLCRENQAIAIEDLAVENMRRNRRLARSVSDAGWSGIRRQLSYKVGIYRDELAIVDRWFPSSKLCRKCGAIKNALRLSDRVFRCECGHEEDRDVNAARNICTEGFSENYAWGDGGAGCGIANRNETAIAEPRTKPCPHSDAI